jgi:hypothetical protein
MYAPLHKGAAFMNRRLDLVLSIVAGLVGGIFCQALFVTLVRAQNQPVPPKELSAERYILVNKQGTTSGVFGFDKDGSPEITLLDARGRVIWSTKIGPETIQH